MIFKGKTAFFQPLPKTRQLTSGCLWPDRYRMSADNLQVNTQVNNHKITQVRYLSRKERKVPVEWLNPMFLVNNPPLD